MGMEVEVEAAEDNANDVETSLLLMKQDMVKALKGASKVWLMREGEIKR